MIWICLYLPVSFNKTQSVQLLLSLLPHIQTHFYIKHSNILLLNLNEMYRRGLHGLQWLHGFTAFKNKHLPLNRPSPKNHLQCRGNI